MKGRSCAFAIVLLLFAAASGYSRTTPQKSSAKKAQANQIQKPNGDRNYRVRPGDSLYKIAREFRTTPQAIQSVNGLTTSKLKVGRILSIPGSKKLAAAKKEAPVFPKASRQQNETYMSAANTQPTDADKASETSSTPLRLVQAGFQMIGIRYRFGGSEISGIDCSGLVKSLFSKFNIDLPRSSKEQFKQGEKVSKDDLKPGDLVFFSSGGNQPTHVGIYVGNNQLLHAARKAGQVVVSDISKVWDTMRYLGARRVMELWGDDPVPESDTN
jgi:cell wall-associated NlpC family hydrolase